MKQSVIFVMSLILMSPAFASPTPSVAKAYDAQREGNLKSIAVEYFNRNVVIGSDPCRMGDDSFSETVTPDVQGMKLSSSSGVDKPTSNVSYTANYIVTRACFMGATGAGAERTVVDAAIIQCERYGVENPAGIVVPSRPDQCKLIRVLDVNELGLSF